MKINKKSKWLISTTGLIFIIIIILIWFVSLSSPTEPKNMEIIDVEILSGSTTSDIASTLKDYDLIKSKVYFQLHVKNMGYDSKLKAGTYQLSKSMSLSEVIQKLIEGNNKVESVRFTIPEGYNVDQIADRLSAEGLVDRELFLQLSKEGNFDYKFIKDIPNDKNIKYKLEGYLFPETYEVKKGASEEDIINKMLLQFEKEWNPEWDKILEEKNMTIHQLVSLASIVEREVRVDSERPIVAGIFYNRLNDSWNLQSCATVQYILGKQRESLTYADLEIINPYNTYINGGLPPGPIGSPGRLSLAACVYPDKNNYYFFVTKKDDSGEHYFSSTYSEHLNYDATSRGNW
ncbi:MAG: endolytic transglycosylase MltG [Vulcanibacillus sp.]